MAFPPFPSDALVFVLVHFVKEEGRYAAQV